MSEENKESPNQFSQKFANNVAKAAHTGKTALKAAGKAGAGNIAGAVLEIVKDENFRKAIVAVVLLFFFLISSVGLMIGSFLWGAVNYLCNTWSENWNENWEDSGIASNGSAIYLYTIGALDSFKDTVGDTFRDLFVKDQVHKKYGNDATNSALSDGGSNVFSETDSENTVRAVTDNEALSGQDGAIMRRINMIQTRVAQRGKQLEQCAIAQYSLEGLANLAANWLRESFRNPCLFCGIDWNSSGVQFDKSAFELTELQAIKILAAYSMQYDCDFSAIDMWSIMDYVGWYDVALERLDIEETESIYNSTTSVAVQSETGSIPSGVDISSGMASGQEDNSSRIIQFSSLIVPKWRGEFKPQRYVEEQAQIKEHNSAYWDLVEHNKEIQPENELWGIQASKDSEIQGFDNQFSSYGLLDKMFTETRADMTLTAIEYAGFDAAIYSTMATLFGESASDWAELEGSTDIADTYGNYITPESITYYGAGSEASKVTGNQTYALVNTSTNKCISSCVTAEDAKNIYFSNLQANTRYAIYNEAIAKNRQPTEESAPIYVFTTPRNPLDGKTPYKLGVQINVSFSTRSIDSLISDVIGLWRGSLDDTVTTDSGVYNAGHEGNNLLLRDWENTYTDSSGIQHTLEFTRQSGFQAEAYEDMVVGLGELMGLDTSTLFQNGESYGQDIVATALAEWEYYTDNGLSGGGRFWDEYYNYCGTRYGPNTAWCVCFVYYCAYKCGYLTDGGCFGTEWYINTGSAWSYFYAQGLATTDNSYVPVPGDIMLFAHGIATASGSNTTHIGIVEATTEDGGLWVIEGNYNNSLHRTYYSSYQVGSYLYTNNGRSVNIGGYIHPQYPATYPEDMAYSHLGSKTAPSAYAKNVVGENHDLYPIIGMPRFTMEQVPAVLDELRSSYPELWTDDLEKSLLDPTAFAKAWNAICFRNKDEFVKAQMSIAAKLFITPLQTQILQDTSFNWTRTDLRKEILWAIATTSDNQQEIISAMEYLCANLENNATDSAVLQELVNRLPTMESTYKNSLWGNYDIVVQDDFISGINKLPETLAQKYNLDLNTGAAL